MAEETTPKSRRDGMTERLKKKYPDREYADDEALFGQISDDYDEYDRQLSGYRDNEKKLTDLFNESPKNAKYFTDLAKGKDLMMVAVEELGIDGITDLINDPEKKEEMAAANQEYLKRVAKEKELQEIYEKNLSESLSMLEKVQQERGLTDDQIDAAYDLINQIAGDMVLGKISEQSIDMALKAINHDADVATASDEGMIAGKNAKAEEKLRKPKKGDGTPNLQGSNNGPSNKAARHKNIFDLAMEA